MARRTHGSRRRALMRAEARLAFLGLLAIAGLLALNPGVPGIPAQFLGWDKLEHAAAFAALALLLRCGWPEIGWRLQAAGLFAYGVAIELIQGLPAIGRTPSLGDVVADCVGVAVGLLLGEAALQIEKRLPGRS